MATNGLAITEGLKALLGGWAQGNQQSQQLRQQTVAQEKENANNLFNMRMQQQQHDLARQQADQNKQLTTAQINALTRQNKDQENDETVRQRGYVDTKLKPLVDAIDAYKIAKNNFAKTNMALSGGMLAHRAAKQKVIALKNSAQQLLQRAKSTLPLDKAYNIDWNKEIQPYDFNPDNDEILDADEIRQRGSSGGGTETVTGTTAGRGFDGTVSPPTGINVKAPSAIPATTQGLINRGPAPAPTQAATTAPAPTQQPEPTQQPTPTQQPGMFGTTIGSTRPLFGSQTDAIPLGPKLLNLLGPMGLGLGVPTNPMGLGVPPSNVNAPVSQPAPAQENNRIGFMQPEVAAYLGQAINAVNQQAPEYDYAQRVKSIMGEYPNQEFYPINQIGDYAVPADASGKGGDLNHVDDIISKEFINHINPDFIAHMNSSFDPREPMGPQMKRIAKEFHEYVHDPNRINEFLRDVARDPAMRPFLPYIAERLHSRFNATADYVPQEIVDKLKTNFDDLLKTKKAGFENRIAAATADDKELGIKLAKSKEAREQAMHDYDIKTYKPAQVNKIMQDIAESRKRVEKLGKDIALANKKFWTVNPKTNTASFKVSDLNAVLQNHSDITKEIRASIDKFEMADKALLTPQKFSEMKTQYDEARRLLGGYEDAILTANGQGVERLIAHDYKGTAKIIVDLDKQRIDINKNPIIAKYLSTSARTSAELNKRISKNK